MKMKSLTVIAAAMMFVGCAHAGGFAGKWASTTNQLTINAVDGGKYLGKLYTADGDKTQNPTLVYFARPDGGTLHGTYNNVPLLAVTAVLVDARHLRVTFPDQRSQVFERK